MKRSIVNNFPAISSLSAFPFACAALILFFSITLNGQEKQAFAQNFHQWGAITLFNGLPSDNVRAIEQTPDGILWFGTDNGLARFDGRRVQTVPLGNFESGKILALKVSPEGTLWIGTERGAYLLQNGKFQLIEETKDFAITFVLIAEDVFLATGNGFIIKLGKTTENSFFSEKIPAEPLVGSDGKPLQITSLARNGEIIVAGTLSRSILLVEGKNVFETFSRPRPFFVNTIAENVRGNIWLGADEANRESGFFSLDDIARPRRVGDGLGTVLSIESGDTSGEWVGTAANGLFHFQNERQISHFTFENTAGGLRSNKIQCLFLDRENVVWVGTDRGISRYDSSSPFIQSLSEDSNRNFVRIIFKAQDGRLFAGTNLGLFLLNDEKWIENENFSQRTVYAIGEDSSKQLLIGTPSGLFDLDGKSELTGDARSTAVFKNKVYAAVFGRGVVEIAGEKQNLIFADDSATALFADDEKLFIGTAKNGVFIFDGKEIVTEKRLENLRGSAIWKIAKGAEKDLWFASEHGLFQYKSDELRNVIPNQNVRDVTVAGADIWAATLSGGILHAKFDDVFGLITANLNVEQGLPSQRIFALFLSENRLFVGTNRGIVNYVPSSIPPLISASRVLSQRIYDSPEISNVIDLEYPQNSLLVEVAGLSSRTFPEQFQYAFTLKNSKGEILEKKLSNDAQFAPRDLSAGEYSIEARAFNKDLLASKPLIISFSVARSPFPWTATALGVLLTIASIALIWGAIESRRISQRNRELAAARFDLANEAERERRRIARDLHDQTLSDLRNLMLKSDKITTDNSNFRSEIESVSTEIRRICEDLSPSVLENVGLVAALEFLLQNTFENYKFSATDNLEEQIRFSPNVQMQIYRIAQEVLSNIKRHSNADFVQMNVAVSENNEFFLGIADDGTTFTPVDDLPKGRGISNIKSRAALIEAEISWKAAEKGGTIFQFRK